MAKDAIKKSELVAIIAEKTKMTKKDVTAALDAFVNQIEDALQDGKEVSFIGFGTFSTVKKAARKGKVPGTDKVIDIPATTSARFKVGKLLKDRVRDANK